MKTSKIISGLLIFMAILIGVLSVVLCSFAVTQQPMLITQPREAAAAAEQVLNAVHQGDFTAAAEGMQGKPDLGLDREPADTVGKLLWAEFPGSFTYALKGQCYAVDTGMALDVTVSYLDFNSIIANLGQRTGKLLEQKVKAAEDPAEIYDEQNNYRQELVDEALTQAVAEAMEKNAKNITEDLTLRLVHENGQWWVVPAPALIHVISGGTVG